ncbi:hypothetical protein C6A37_05035 [Desulfobacteraceae bacterium SEEP-SAG9]|nr:hypothetical protein C6A37_05035 [Desulfobacteraceae bacterium SEEP-SAG9]
MTIHKRIQRFPFDFFDSGEVAKNSSLNHSLRVMLKCRRSFIKKMRIVFKVEDQLKAHRIDSDLFTTPTEIKILPGLVRYFT